MSKRCVKTMVCLLTIILALCSLGNATALVENKEETISFRGDLTQAEFEQSMKMFQFSQSSFLAQETGPMTEQEDVDIYGFKGKSVKKAFAYSLLVPGSGEFYAGSKIKAAAFLGIDIALWALYFNYRGQGKDEEKKYRTFADGNWIQDEYSQWLIDSVYVHVSTPNPNVTYENVCDSFPYWDTEENEWTYFSHRLPDSKTNQYYEMIGKYNQFRWGWDDFDGLSSFLRDDYMDMRHDANNLLNKATHLAMFSLANHILSAFDAAISVRKYNKKGERFGQLNIQMRLVEREREIIPRLTLSTRF